MKTLPLGLYALGICAAALLIGCGGLQVPIGAPNSQSPVATRDKKHSKTFDYTGSEQTFTVPKGVTQITVTVSGASGASQGGSSSFPGTGGLVVATLPVTPGKALAVFVGGEGSGSSGGYNGGGNGAGESSSGGLGGGGASDVRQDGDSLANRIVVAGGGGGQGEGGYSTKSGGAAGGSGGGKKGLAGLPLTQSGLNAGGGEGGTQRDGGSGGKGGVHLHCDGQSGTSGSLGQGGSGGDSCFYYKGDGGGGGGGYYGGGGGGGSGADVLTTGYANIGSPGGGGGGSSYVEKNATHVTDKAGGAALGNGQIIISWQ